MWQPCRGDAGKLSSVLIIGIRARIMRISVLLMRIGRECACLRNADQVVVDYPPLSENQIEPPPQFHVPCGSARVRLRV